MCVCIVCVCVAAVRLWMRHEILHPASLMPNIVFPIYNYSDIRTFGTNLSFFRVWKVASLLHLLPWADTYPAATYMAFCEP